MIWNPWTPSHGQEGELRNKKPTNDDDDDDGDDASENKHLIS